MKKALALLSIAFVAQGLLAEPIQYKYLNELHPASQVRKTCEQVNRARFVKSETEKACDLLDNMFATCAQFHRDNYHDYEKLNPLGVYGLFSSEARKQYEEGLASYMLRLEGHLPSQEQQDKACSILGVDLKGAEGKYIAFLGSDVLEQAARQARQAKNKEQEKRHQFIEWMKQNQN